MNQKRTFHYYRPGNLSGLELTLNAMSRGGWQAVKPGRFVQRYAQGEGCWLHRFDYCGDRPGSAGAGVMCLVTECRARASGLGPCRLARGLAALPQKRGRRFRRRRPAGAARGPGADSDAV